MSWRALAWSKRQTVGSPPAKTVLLLLADRYSEEWGRAWPSREEIAKISELSVKTVSRAIRHLELGGWITVETWVYENGARYGNRYYLDQYRPEVKHAGQSGVPLKVCVTWSDTGKVQVERLSDWALLQG